MNDPRITVDPASITFLTIGLVLIVVSITVHQTIAEAICGLAGFIVSVFALDSMCHQDII